MAHQISRRSVVVQFGLAAAAVFAAPAAESILRGQQPTRHDVTVSSRKYEFSPARIEVVQDDVVRITMVAEDIPHSLTIDEYRIAKRAAPGRPVTFEFRADKPGSFTFHCDLAIDDGCREMRGELVVVPR